ncbi:MAG TPA: MFS transporter [Saprospiraceae bacterium]|nr:MFS transporter [Saprospiraceae bacterium]
MFSHITKDFLGNKQSLSIGVAFVTIGFLVGNWATFIPFIKHKFDLDDGQLGLLLLSMPFGAVTMNSVAAWMIKKWGMKLTTFVGLILLLTSFALLLNAPYLPLMAFIMFLCGSGISITNVGMNTCVGAIELHLGLKIMSTCHGMFSLGLMMGSLASSFFGGLGWVPGLYMVGVSLFMSVFALLARPNIVKIQDYDPDEISHESSKFSFPKGSFLLMILIGICINITEGSMTDWTAVYMREIVQSNKYYEGWGLAGYSLFMAIGRLMGDRIVPIYGANKVLFFGAITAITGIGIVILFPNTFTAILGFSMVGAGVSCGAPILYASAARVPNMPKGSGLAVMNTFAMGGFLFGPVIIGFISKALSLPMAFGLLAILGIVWMVNARRVILY